MFSTRALASVFLIALSAVDADLLHDSREKVPIVPRMGTGGFKNVIASDKARINTMKQGRIHGKRSNTNLPLNDGAASSFFTTQVSIATGTAYTLLVDTGSSLTWVGARSSNPYKPTQSSVDTGVPVSVEYGGGLFHGKKYYDTLTLSSSLSVRNQGIGAADYTSGIDSSVDGILGLGPVIQTSAYTPDHSTIPTVTDNLYSQKLIQDNALGVYVVPLTYQTAGELYFGGADLSKNTSDVKDIPLTTKSPMNELWGIDLSVVGYGGNTILSAASGVVDTGVSLLYIPSHAFSLYMDATGGVQDLTTGLWEIDSNQYNSLQNLSFVINFREFDLIPNAQIWPRSLNTDVGGNSDSIYLIVGDGGQLTGGLDLILGFAFLQRYYTVYDTANQKIGIASTKYTGDMSN